MLWLLILMNLCQAKVRLVMAMPRRTRISIACDKDNAFGIVCLRLSSFISVALSCYITFCKEHSLAFPLLRRLAR